MSVYQGRTRHRFASTATRGLTLKHMAIAINSSEYTQYVTYYVGTTEAGATSQVGNDSSFWYIMYTVIHKLL